MVSIENGKLYHSESDDLDSLTEVLDYETGYHLDDNVSFDGMIRLRDVLRLIQNNTMLRAIYPRYAFVRNIVDCESVPQEHEEIKELAIGMVFKHTYTLKTPTIDFESMDEQEYVDGSKLMVMGYEDRPYTNTSHYYDLSGIPADTSVHERYSISLTPLNEIIDLPITLNGKTHIIIEDERNGTKYHQTGDVEYINLYDFLYTIMEEITFHGGDDEKSDITQQLRDSMEQINKKDNDKDG